VTDQLLAAHTVPRTGEVIGIAHHAGGRRQDQDRHRRLVEQLPEAQQAHLDLTTHGLVRRFGVQPIQRQRHVAHHLLEQAHQRVVEEGDLFRIQAERADHAPAAADRKRRHGTHVVLQGALAQRLRRPGIQGEVVGEGRLAGQQRFADQ
jgi:hypothetical protein